MDLKNPTRTEALLANIAGHTDVPVPDMKNATRSERLLKEILDNGGGGGGDVTKEYVDTAIADAVADIDDDISALSDTVADKVDKENGKSLSTNDYTDADKALVQNSPITVTATGAEITASTAQGNLNALTVYGKSEVVDGSIKSAGEGWATVDLGTLTWIKITDYTNPIFIADVNGKKVNSLNYVCAKYVTSNIITGPTALNAMINGQIGAGATNASVYICATNPAYTDATAFKTAMSGVILAYQLADPTQGNTIAVKTDDGTGINGTMAVFETGTPLYGVSDTVRDVMQWDGSVGTVAKVCGKVRLADLTWQYNTHSSLNPFFWTYSENLPDGNIKYRGPFSTTLHNLLCSTYPTVKRNGTEFINKTLTVDGAANLVTQIQIKDTDYTTAANFVASLGDAELVYELATPTTEQLTTAENASIAGLRTFTPQTHAQNNAGATMTIEAYANTANGQAISDMQPTRSPLLTLSASGWTNNAQTVTYEHDIGKRNTIDVEPTSIKAWTAAGILATAETASTITFECDTVPTSDLSFRVTSMEVR